VRRTILAHSSVVTARRMLILSAIGDKSLFYF
jgi:hypothetical protein